MIPVAIDVETRRVVEGIGDAALGLLSQATDRTPDIGNITEEELQELETQAFAFADNRRVESAAWARDTQTGRLAARRATLERGYRARISRKRATLARVHDLNIVRLYQGEIRNLEATLEMRLRTLTTRRSRSRRSI